VTRIRRWETWRSTRGCYDEAAACFAKAVQTNPRFSLYYFLQATALALAGRVEEARPIAGQLLELEPDLSQTWSAGPCVRVNKPSHPAKAPTARRRRRTPG
jgi:tetratricopeptide (TPR) repeat protein